MSNETNKTETGETEADKGIQPGRYRVKPLRCFLTESRGDDPKPQLCITVRHLEGKHAGREDSWYGGLHTDDATEKSLATLRDCGWTGNNIEEVTFAESAEASAVYERDDYQGKVRVKLRYLNPSAFVPRALDASRLDGVRSRVAQALARVDAKRPSVPVPEAARPHIAKVQAAATPEEAARVWLASAPTLTDEGKRALWTAVLAKHDGEAVKAAIGAIKAAAQKPAPTANATPTVANMGMPQGW